MTGRRALGVRFDVAPERAFDYLVDPRNRSQWQSSLRRVEDVEGEPRPGQSWVDVTVPGLRPRMTTTVLDRPTRWTEEGRWRGIRAELTLHFAPAGSGTLVTPTVRVTGRDPARVPARIAGRVVGRVAGYAVRPDLRRAARILAGRADR